MSTTGGRSAPQKTGAPMRMVKREDAARNAAVTFASHGMSTTGGKSGRTLQYICSLPPAPGGTSAKFHN